MEHTHYYYEIRSVDDKYGLGGRHYTSVEEAIEGYEHESRNATDAEEYFIIAVEIITIFTENEEFNGKHGFIKQDIHRRAICWIDEDGRVWDL